jgi:ceramide glucosyltransferase
MAIIGFICLGLAAGYGVLAALAVILWRRQRWPEPTAAPPAVTILKPLCGAEPGLYAHLSSFCRQDYPEYQIVFGVRDRGDPACAVVERLAAEYPQVPIELVVNPQLHGSNSKVSNLINILPHVRHDILVMADSDAFVRPNYLAAVTSPLRAPNVGLVTCIYEGAPTPGIWSRLGAMYINAWYMPSVLVAWLFGHQGYVSGQTVVMRRDTLTAIGGLEALSNHLADDYRLGELVRRLGLRVVISPYAVHGEHHEPTFDALVRHELRWMSTLRVLRPYSFRFIFITFGLPLAAAGMAAVLLADRFTLAAWALFAVALAGRLVLHFVHRMGNERLPASDLWLLPVRDALLLWVWWRTFFTSHLTWRGIEFDVDADGIMHPLR